ncbi:SRPBCC family protein, partial [Cutibacterium acnes]
ITIAATPEVVFEAIRKQRNSTEQHRSLEKFDGKVAVIKEHLENVPIYGKVDCVWEETEQPYKRIDYKMVSSTKFKEGFGSWILTPSADGKTTTLEFDSYTDSGLMVPFGGELTKMESMKTSKARLAHIKQVAEDMQKHGGLKDAKAEAKGETEKSEKSEKPEK